MFYFYTFFYSHLILTEDQEANNLISGYSRVFMVVIIRINL